MRGLYQAIDTIMDRSLKYWLFIGTVLSSHAFFNYHDLISESFEKLMLYSFILLGLVVAINDGVSISKYKAPMPAYVLLLVSILFSAFMAFTQHQQGLDVSLLTILQTLIPYGFFFVMLRFGISKERIMNAYIVICAVSSVVYFLNIATVPNNIFGKPIISLDETRGIIRVPVVYIEFFPMLVFYGINKWFDTKNKKWFVLIGWASLMIFLSVIRQIIALTGVLAILFLFRNVSWLKKIALACVVVGVVAVVLPQIPMYKTMLELSEDQKDENENEENIRIQAWRYFTYENQDNTATRLFGNGFPSFGNSIWGKICESDADLTGKLQFDVGWAGLYWYYGIFAVGALLFIFIKTISRRKDRRDQYLNYWYIFILVTSVASAPILYYYQIITVCVGLAMAYLPDTDQSESESESDLLTPGVDKDNEERMPKYPQLTDV